MKNCPKILQVKKYSFCIRLTRVCGLVATRPSYVQFVYGIGVKLIQIVQNGIQPCFILKYCAQKVNRPGRRAGQIVNKWVSCQEALKMGRIELYCESSDSPTSSNSMLLSSIFNLYPQLSQCKWYYSFQHPGSKLFVVL